MAAATSPPRPSRSGEPTAPGPRPAQSARRRLQRACPFWGVSVLNVPATRSHVASLELEPAWKLRNLKLNVSLQGHDCADCDHSRCERKPAAHPAFAGR